MKRQNVGILDYKTFGNIGSVFNAIAKTSNNPVIVSSKSDLSKVGPLILPGVGSFSEVMNFLNQSDLYDAIEKKISSVPVMGICLGMQILSSSGSECGSAKGFGFFDGSVKKISSPGVLPHVGYAKLNITNQKLDIFKNIDNDSFYFMHSYEVLTKENIIATTEYLSHEFVSAVQKDNIVGVQFHPERSGLSGIQILKNFLNLS